MPTAPFIVIDGPDGCGKGTQTKLLVERLRRENVQIEQYSFPSYSKPEAFFVEQYLNGRYSSMTDVGPKRASMFYALDRYHASHHMRELLEGGITIISDRYVSASKGHQMAQLKDPIERKAFLDWLNELEYGIMGIPKPDLTVLLHIPSGISYELIAKKDARGYLDGKKRDILEADAEHLKAAEAAYLEMPNLDTVERWQKIECVENGNLLSIETIHERLYDLVTQQLTKTT